VTPRDRWLSFDRPYAPRIAVDGGVRVARPGAVTSDAASRLVALIERRTTQGIGSRGRTYARAGQVVEVRIVDGSASAAIQGSDAEPYAVALEHENDGAVEARCSCPYGCDALEWCKHAAALAYVVAHLVDTDRTMATAWLGADGDQGPVAGDPVAGDPVAGEPAAGGSPSAPSAGTPKSPADPTVEQVAALVTRLRAPRTAVDGPAQWAAAIDVLRLP
jgi:hypothetical protein